MICLLASKMCWPAYGGTVASNSPRELTGVTGSMPAASVTALSSSPYAGAMCTIPVPSSTDT